ncbi:ADP compounds hydrolase NudE [Thiohalobacter sp. IOR34]|uniref:ADP compounds hydrolase NudE n=1 Tax=Thiohalobacter sp. IOR34 TaxID=3057176 RepID=UPI0025B12AA8|nr:ADP compounds hydrolase NudE [Thiohalobacter sp. IOR34]WJW75218.1 ADP compounds hydrolase NudE [Thiohalobacter sp. IOR34]
MPELPQILRVTTLARSRLFEIQQLDLRFSNGVETQYERLRGSGAGAVLVVPMRDAETLLLVREYAAGTERYELGFPKGRIEAGEDPLATADRELKEEIGYGARKLTPLHSVTVAPGYFGHLTHLVLAEDLYEERQPGDEPEDMEIVSWPLAELDALLARDDFTEARSIAALFLVRERMKNND